MPPAQIRWMRNGVFITEFGYTYNYRIVSAKDEGESVDFAVWDPDLVPSECVVMDLLRNRFFEFQLRDLWA